MMGIKGNNLILAAKSFLGKAYVWGGESDLEGGYDCSGLFYAAMLKAGEKIGRLSSQGYYNKYQTKTKYQFIEAGFILFFGKSTSKISHIAIAVDSKNMIESVGSSKNTKLNPGKGVCINPIKRRSDFICAIDIFEEFDRYYPAYKGPSLKIDVVFGAIGAPYGNVAKRLNVAKINGFSDYKGTYLQNLSLIRLAKAGKLKKV